MIKGDLKMNELQTSKTKICPVYFYDNIHKYLTNSEDINQFKSFVKESAGWTNRDLWFPPMVKDKKNGCLRGCFGSYNNWEIIADDLNKSQIPFLESFQFEYEYPPE